MKFIRIDNFLASALVFALMALLPLILEIDSLKPFKETFTDLQVTDIAFSKLRQKSSIRACPQVVIVNTENLTNGKFAVALSKIISYKPKAIGIGKVFKRGEGSEMENRILKTVLSGAPNLVMECRMSGYSSSGDCFTKIDAGDDYFTSGMNLGYTNFFNDEKKEYTTVRSFAPVSLVGGRKRFAFAYRAAAMFDPKSTAALLARGKERETINYKGAYDKFFYEFGENILDGQANPELFEGKIVLMGNANFMGGQERFEDLYFTPLNEDYSGRTQPDMFGLLIHANIIAMILEHNYFTTMPQIIGLIIAFILCYFNMGIFDYISEKYKKWYELTSLMIFMTESLLILIATVYIFLVFKYEIRLTESLFAAALSLVVFDGYTYSIKPMAISLYYKYFRRRR